MKKNISTTDRLIRAILAIVFMMLMLDHYEDEIIRILAGTLGVYCLLTAVLEICLLYNLLKVSSKPSKRDRHFY